MSVIHILIVEDEREIAEVLRDYMINEGYDATVMDSGNDVVPFVRKSEPTLLLLDLMLPGKDGKTICQKIRAFSKIPIIMITAKVDEVDRIIGLEMGADDYVCKPFSPREVVARVNAVLRRTGPPPGSRIESFTQELVQRQTTLSAGAFTLYEEGRQLFINDQEVALTPSEFEIIKVMLRRPGRVFTRGQLIELVQGYNFKGYERTIDFHIKNLRKKIAQHLPYQKIIQAAYGVGYKFVI